MNWHVAEAIFQSSIDGARPDYAPFTEWSWFLISAPDEEAALAKATDLAKAKRESYANAAGELVRWVFVRIERVRQIMDVELGDGTEVWAEIERAPMDEASTNGSVGTPTDDTGGDVLLRRKNKAAQVTPRECVRIRWQATTRATS